MKGSVDTSGNHSLRTREEMRPQAGVDRLKPVAPLQAHNLPIVGQALSPANHILSQQAVPL